MDKFRGYFWSFLVLLNFLSFVFCQSETTCLEGEKAKQYNERLTQDHNKYRSLHGTPPLEADDKLMEGATQWSRKLITEDKFEHSHGEDGENLYTESSTDPLTEAEIDAVKPWYDEIKLYTKPEFSAETGHFTQVVWRDTRKVGCGLCSKLDNGMTKVMVTCRYSPKGNIRGQFKENVPDLLKSGASTANSEETSLTDTTEEQTIDTEVDTFDPSHFTPVYQSSRASSSTGTGASSIGTDTSSFATSQLTTGSGETGSTSETTSSSKETTTSPSTGGTATTTTSTSKPTTDSTKTTSKGTTTATTARPDENSNWIEEILFVTVLVVLILCLVPLGILLVLLYKQMIYLR
ncbi:uncharacterized protein LOC135844371 isoform X2 [Planococcus citri]|uniref:uncharacterized protein LOC135844371 isoform X2 n=1 Tax=Planococcus citri TaxID=170843 RepID=UPI0031F9B388